VRIVTDRSRTTVAGEIQRVGQALEAYGRTVGALRLMARGVSPTIALAVAIEIDDVAAPESGGAQLLAMVPMLLLMSVFVGGMYVAVDVTAGERERGSLEPLLANPITASDVVLGKLGAVVFFAGAALVLSDVAFTLVIGVAPFPDVPGMKFKLDVFGALQILAALVPLLLPICALQMLLAGRSRSVKEGNTAVMLLTMVPMLPGLFLAFTPFKPTISSMAVPVFAQEVLVNQILRGAPLPPHHYLAAAATSIALGMALTVLVIVRTRRERASL
jgi:sodium transport system permease protein